MKYGLVKSGIWIMLLFIFSPVATTAHDTAGVATIHIDETSVTPQTLTVPVGTTVVFENIGKEGHWIASDDHPSHTLYDGTTLEQHCADAHTNSFDSCAAIAAGTQWEFTFNTPGTFSFHDHLWPHLVGEITVFAAPKKQSVWRQLFDSAFGPFAFLWQWLPEKDVAVYTGDTHTVEYTALKNHFVEVVNSRDPRAAIQELRTASEESEQTLALCHDVLHAIGGAAYQKYGSFEAAMEYQEDFCNSGYIHGVFEAYFQAAPEPLSGLSEQCSQYASGKRPFDLWQCYHGIGHGLMYLTGGDLDQSLALCATHAKADVSSCYNGVYMELLNAEVLAKEAEFIVADNPVATCEAREPGKGDCYFYLPTYFSQTQKLGFADIFARCDAASTMDYAMSCVAGVGTEAIKRNLKNPDAVFELCTTASSGTQQAACISGAVGMYLNQMGSIKAGELLCNNTTKAHQSICQTTVEKQTDFFSVNASNK